MLSQLTELLTGQLQLVFMNEKRDYRYLLGPNSSSDQGRKTSLTNMALSSPLSGIGFTVRKGSRWGKLFAFPRYQSFFLRQNDRNRKRA